MKPNRLDRAAEGLAPDNVDLSVLKTTVGFMIRIVQLQIFQAYYDRLRPHGVTTGVYSVLVAIAANPGIKQGVLGQAMIVKRSNMTKLINQLVAQDLVARRPSAVDKRAMDLYLTAKGHEALTAVDADAVTHDREVTAALTPQERQTFLRLLDKLSQDLRARRSAD